MREMIFGIVSARLRRRAELRLQQRLSHCPQHRLDHREIDAGDIAGPSPVPERGSDQKGEHQPTHWVEPGEANPRRDSRVAIKSGKTGIALQQGAVGDRAGFRPGPAEAGCRDVNQVGVDPLQVAFAETQPVHDPGREVFDQHVAFGGECLGDSDTLRPFEVKHNATLRLAEHSVQFRCASILITSAPIAAR